MRHNRFHISAALGLFACLSLAACDKKGSGTTAPGAASVPASSAANTLAAGVWADLVSADQPRMVAAWTGLARADAALLRQATYTVAAPPNDDLHLGTLAVKWDTSTLKAWDRAFVGAFPQGAGQDAAQACFALDQLAAGVMESGPTFAPLMSGARAFAYEQAILVRMYALSKLNAMDPESTRDPKGTLGKLQGIARSGEIARIVP